MQMLTIKTSLAALVAAVFSPAFPAVTGQWIFHDTSTAAAERTFDGASDWFDAGNWTNGFVAAGTDVLARFWPSYNWHGSGVRYVKVDRDLTVAHISRWWNNTVAQSTIDENRRVVLAGDNTVTLDRTSGVAGMKAVRLYGALRIASSKGIPEFFQCDFCGPVANGTGYYPGIRVFRDMGYVRFRRDLWADGTGEGITNFAFTTYNFDAHGAACFYAPAGSDGATGLWTLTNGSAIARLAGAAHTLSAGAAVTGDGVPDGTYVKRIYSGSIIELSAAATNTSAAGGTELAFGAFRPKAYQRIDAFSAVSHKTAYRIGFWPMKHADADEMTVEIFDLKPTDGVYHLYVDCESGYLPGRVVLHNTSTFKRDLYLGTCEVEFAATTNGTPAGFPNTVRLYASTDVANVRVPEGVNAAFGALSAVVGTFVKTGGGRLTAPVASDSAFNAGETGAVSVEEGTLALTGAGGDPLRIASLSLAAGSTFQIPSNGVEIAAFSAASGAVVGGAGVFYVYETNDVSGVVFGGDVSVRRVPVPATTSDAAEFYWETNVTAGVVGTPAYWFDVSDRDSFVYADPSVSRRGYEDRILAWRDARGASHGCATCFWAGATTPRPQYVYTNRFGETRMVMVYDSSSSEPAKRNVLQWDRRVTGIRSVFKVVPSLGTTSVFLGGSNRARGSNRSYSFGTSIFSSAPESYVDGLKFYVNGDRRDWRDGYPYGVGRTDGSSYYNGDPDLLPRMLVELHFPDGTTYAGNFGYNAKDDNGRDYLCECLVYTNELTEAERLSVRKYLSAKWLDARLNSVPAAFDGASPLDAGAGVSYSVGSGEASVRSALEGDGALVKYGEGTLVFGKTSSNALHVAEGELRLRARAVPSRSEIAAGAYLHLDASEASSLVVENGKVVSWADVRGEGYPAATALNSGKGPAYEENALNGMPAIDFGKHAFARIATYGAKSPALLIGPVSNAHAVVAVLVSVDGGGPLFGWHIPSRKSTDGNIAWGLDRDLRYSGGNASNPIVDGETFSGEYFDLGYSARPGGARIRLNNADVDGSKTPFTCNGTYDLVSLVSHRPIRAGAIGQIGSSNNHDYFNYGGYKICEMILYTNVVSRAEVLAAEAYLNKKWFGRVSEGYEPAAAASVTVDDGARMEIWGGAPIEVGALAAAGTLDGDVSVADGGVIAVSVAADGTVPSLGVTGALRLAGGGTLALSGNTGGIAEGRYPLAAVGSGGVGDWAVTTSAFTDRKLLLSIEDGVLVLTVVPPGLTVILR